MTEKEYWNKASLDPQVDIKYISDIPSSACLNAIGKLKEPILEIGCGVGRLLPDGATGVDISSGMLKIAKQRNPNAHYYLNNGKTLPFTDRHFRNIYSVLTFQHCDINTVTSYIAEAYRVLKIRGVFRFQFVEGNYSGFNDHNHLAEVLIEILLKTGFTIDKVEPNLVHNQWTWITAIK